MPAANVAKPGKAALAPGRVPKPEVVTATASPTGPSPFDAESNASPFDVSEPPTARERRKKHKAHSEKARFFVITSCLDKSTPCFH
eukprot:symbB.v1.2.001237.t1/scaffold63.1/size477159/8